MNIQLILLSCLLSAASAGAQSTNPVRLAVEARLDLSASASVGALTGGSAALGGGYAHRGIWLPAGEQPRSYSAQWPVTHFRWSEVGLSFLPASNGVVSVDLLGPWVMSPGGTIYRQEILWDDIRAEGAVISNGSFEAVTSGLPVGWANPWGGAVVLDGSVVEGRTSARVWHDRRLRVVLAVTGGQPVALRARARAALPDGLVDNPRIPGARTRAHQAARRFMRGINFSNFFEAPAGEDWGGGPLGTSDFAAVRAEGFDHIRLPVSWNYHTGPGPDYGKRPRGDPLLGHR